MTNQKGLAAAVAALAVVCLAIAHPDDPKAAARQKPYNGPGYRAADGGIAGGGFESDGVTLMAWLPLNEFWNGPHDNGNDCWGYVSPSGREYAIMGLYGGTGFVEITDPGDPVILEVINGPDGLWRDVKVYQDHVYSVSESGSGIQVMSMADIDNGNVTLVNTVTSGGTQSTHNLAINTDSGYLYRTGGGSNGLRIYDLADPVNPVYVGEWDERYVHDAQIVSFTEGEYADREIAFCSGGFDGGWTETGLDIVDVTDKDNLFLVKRLFYANAAYSHQLWLSEDRQFIYLNDELDESWYGSPTTTRIINVSDLENAFEVGTFTNGNTAIDHNLYVRDGFIFESNYRSGLRIFDAADPSNPVEVGYFDTYPDNDGVDYNGLWSNYPFFPSGTVIGSDRERGLFIWEVDVLQQPGIVGDLDGDGVVGTSDLVILLGAWGPCDDCGDCVADLDDDCTVGTTDLLLLLGNWG